MLLESILFYLVHSSLSIFYLKSGMRLIDMNSISTFSNSNPNSNVDDGETLPITRSLSRSLTSTYKEDCECMGMGIYYDKIQLRKKVSGAYVLCECQKGLCNRKEEECKAPYDLYNRETKTMEPCLCRPARIKLQILQSLERQAAIPSKYRGKFLDDIEIAKNYNDNLIIALSLAEETVLNFRNETWVHKGLYLHGETGCGKTLLACSLLNEIMKYYQVPVLYAKISRDILAKLRYSFNPNSDTYGTGHSIENRLTSVEALVVDDLGVHKESEWVDSVLYDLIDARYENNLLTIITSNREIGAWKESSEGRIYSRLHEMCRVISINSPDFRTRERQEDPVADDFG